MTSSDDQKNAPSSPWIIRYDSVSEVEQESPEETPIHLEEIEGHIERHIGPVKIVLHEVDPNPAPMDILVVPANSDRKFHYLVTAGMSDLPMSTGEDSDYNDDLAYAELVLALPPHWPLFDENQLQDEEWFYPIEHLKTLARMPHIFNTWLAEGHSVPNATSDGPIGPNCKMTGFVLDTPWIGGDAFSKLRTHCGRTINFLAVYPVHESEMKLKVRKGYTELKRCFEAQTVTEIFNPERPSSAATGWRKFFRL